MPKNSLAFKPKFTLYNIAPRLYCVEMENPYDLAMLFVRYQEYYESQNPNVRGKAYDLDEYMRWYAISDLRRHVKGSNNTFSYVKDFCGFNIPSSVIHDILGKRKFTGGLTMYDGLMVEIYMAINQDLCKNLHSGDMKFYLIGSPKMDSDTLKHEIAHGFYNNLDTYRTDMNELIKATLTKEEIKAFKVELRKFGYCEKVMFDEIQAFLSTGTRSEFPKIKMRRRFTSYFNLYYKTVKLRKIKVEKIKDLDK